MSLTEAEQNVIRTALLDECGAEPLWVVGYGALSPTFDAVEARFATANWFNRQAMSEPKLFAVSPEKAM